MKKYKIRKHGIDFWNVWFANEPIKESGIIQYRQASFQTEGSEEFLSMITDLTQTEEEIVGQFSKSCKYKVNRAPREGVTTEVLFGEQISEQELNDFAEFFKIFWETKGVEQNASHEVKQDLIQYQLHHMLGITKAFYQGECVVYHVHVLANDTARLLHSASLYRTQEDGASNLLGMANRYLHKVDLLAFKELGMTTYDWGGAGTTDDVASITKFKESFGGTKVVQYNTRVHKGFLAKTFQKLVERG